MLKAKGRRLLVHGTWLLLLPLLTAGGSPAPTLTFAFAGDINLARGSVGARAFTRIENALKADLTLANLESPLTDQPKATVGIDLRAPLAAAPALAPFTHLSVENNHALDGGKLGQLQNRQTLQKQHIVPVTREATIQRLQGVPVALISYLDNGEPLPLAAIRQAAQQAKIVIVMPHWGAEYSTTTEQQRQQARQLVGAGATLIVGSGPHVLQGHEHIGGTLVLYSLGNLLFDQPYPAAWLGAVVRVQVRSAKAEVCAVPTLTRSGHVDLAKGKDKTRALERLGLAACP